MDIAVLSTPDVQLCHNHKGLHAHIAGMSLQTSENEEVREDFHSRMKNQIIGVSPTGRYLRYKTDYCRDSLSDLRVKWYHTEIKSLGVFFKNCNEILIIVASNQANITHASKEHGKNP